MSSGAEIAEADVLEALYALGRRLGFSFPHVRSAIEKAKDPGLLLRSWEKIATEEIRYMAWVGSGRGDYTHEFWKSMHDEPEPVDDVWLKRFSRKAWS